MKLEVGMYVRTNEGIGTVQRIYNNKNDCTVRFKKGHVKKWVTIFKASNNIIDLIEVGDYVNGSEVMEADWINEDGEYEEGLAFPMYASDDLNVIENWLPLKNVLIKTIVTKEQFESMSYKIN